MDLNFSVIHRSIYHRHLHFISCAIFIPETICHHVPLYNTIYVYVSMIMYMCIIKDLDFSPAVAQLYIEVVKSLT